MDRGAWQVTVHGVTVHAKSQTQLSDTLPSAPLAESADCGQITGDRG